MSSSADMMSPVVSCMGLEPKSMDVMPSSIVIVVDGVLVGCLAAWVGGLLVKLLCFC